VSVAANLAEVRRRVERAAARAGRPGDGVRIVAASKTRAPEVLLEALDAGVDALGENRVQELEAKMAVIGDRARWHFIGHLQTNKARRVVGAVALVHSVDRLGLAEAMARRAASLGVTQDVLVEVNVASDPSKHGAAPDRTVELARAVDDMAGLRVVGLMTMPPYPEDPEESRPHFRALAALGRELRSHIPRAGALSMGMTRDFEVAVAEGATIVRIGEAIFGARRQI
jgi:pyridoxal phosphate enzyme (YggS family)